MVSQRVGPEPANPAALTLLKATHDRDKQGSQLRVHQLVIRSLEGGRG